MARIQNRSFGLLTVIAAAAFFCVAADATAAGVTPQAVGRSLFHITPYLQNTSPDGVTVMWETREDTSSEVEYWEARSGEVTRRKATDDKPVKIHKVRITGLKPDTPYGYRVLSGAEIREGRFATAPATSRPIRFAIFGDSRFWSDYFQKSPMPQHLLSRGPEFTLHMGDLVNDGRKYRQWPDHFARFESVSSRIPMFPARGNHEHDGSKDPKNDWFGKYHDLPGGEPYSSFDWGNSHFAVVSYTHMNRCASFLDKDLGSTDKKWKFVAFHYPVYCTGYARPSDKRKASGNRELEAIFDKHNVDMVFVGHTHIYERSFPLRGGKRDDRNGTVYLVQGGAVGGNYPDWWTATIARNLDLPHYTSVELADDRIELRSYGLAKGGQRKRQTARIVEIDRCIRWRDEGLPQRVLSGLGEKQGAELLTAIENLGAMCYGPAAPVLVGYLNHSDTRIRQAAPLALERIANASVSDRLVPFLRDRDILVRRHVARALEAAMLPNLAGKIAPEILDSRQDPEVRCRLLGALLLHARNHSLQVAMLALETGNGTVRDRAADVVKRTATRGDVPALLSLFRNERRPYVAGCLAWGLNRLTGKNVDLDKVENSKPGEREAWVNDWRQ